MKKIFSFLIIAFFISSCNKEDKEQLIKNFNNASKTKDILVRDLSLSSKDALKSLKEYTDSLAYSNYLVNYVVKKSSKGGIFSKKISPKKFSEFLRDHFRDGKICRNVFLTNDELSLFATTSVG